MERKKLRVSLGKRLRSCASFDCPGVLPNWEDYPERVQEVLREAGEVFYPSLLYDDLFRSLGKKIFPRNYYHFLGNKIRQTDLFQLLEISHPRTRIYSGRHRAARILADFSFPFVGKTPVGSSQGAGVYLIEDAQGLDLYLEGHRPAYIQEFLPIDRDLRVVLVGGRVIHAYWRVHPPGEFRNNVSLGGRISFEEIPADALEFAQDVAARCGFDDVGLDVCHAQGRYYVLEANMVFGFEGFRAAGLDFYELLARLDDEGFL